MKFKPYEEYKKVDLPWIDEIPSHWRVVKNRKLWNQRNERGFIDKELISVTISNGIIKQEDLLKNTSKRDTSNLDKSRYKLIKKNDIAYNTMRMWQGAVGLSPYEGIVSPAYIVLEPKSNMNYKYYHYLLRTDEYNNESYRNSYGICDDQLKLRYEDFKVMTNIFPPKQEQDKIADFLDHNLAKIDKFVELTERQIELLKEQKEVLINDAVTKGIDKDVAYKDSGIDWIGEIPEHWTIDRIKNITKLASRGVTPIYTDKKLIKVVNQSTFSKGYWDIKNVRYTEVSPLDCRGVLKPKDVLLASTGGGVLGKVYYYTENDLFIADSHVTILRCNDKIISKYLYYHFLIKYDLINGILAQGATNQIELQSLPLKNFKLPIPSIMEQQQIVAYIEKETRKIDRTIELYKNQIELIKEYRTSLIASAVTGKINIRDF